MEKKAIYVSIAMGLGGNISFNYITKELKEHYDRVAVMTPYWDCMECDPYIDRVYKPEEGRDFIMDAKYDNAKIVMHRLYDRDSFIYKSESYADAWRDLCGIPTKGDGEDGSTGEHIYNVYEKFPALKPMVDEVIKQIKAKGYKDFILINFEGGVTPLQQVPADKDGKPDWSKVPDPYENEPLARLYKRERASEFIKLFMAEHPKTAVINYTLPNQANYNVGEFKFVLPYLAYYEMSKLPECKGAVTIDSSLQHLISGNCPVVTLWGHSLPNSFGHVGNKNIIQHCNRDSILYFTMLGKSGAKIDYIEPADLLEEVNNHIFKGEK